MDKDIRMNHSYFTVELGKAVCYCIFHDHLNDCAACLQTKLYLPPAECCCTM